MKPTEINKKIKILAFGEILWDIFGDKKEIGGAPFNFAAHTAKLGAECAIVSAVGNDELGSDALKKVKELEIRTDYITVSDRKTGFCRVTFDGNTPKYELVSGVAYDYIKKPTITEQYDAFYMGTLAQRSGYSRDTLMGLLREVNSKEVFFDINIRQKYYTKEIIEDSLNYTSILKISREEMGVFSELGISEFKDEKDLCRSLSAKYPLKLILVTLDKDGAMLFDCSKKEATYSKKPQSQVVSTVGAGDSFSACFLYNFLDGVPLDLCLDRAVTLSDFVVTKLGAIPDYKNNIINLIKNT